MKKCICAFTFFLTSFVDAQYFSVKPLEAFQSMAETSNSIRELQKNHAFTNAIDYLPEIYVRDGTIDYTPYLQNALNNERHLIMPNFPVSINDNGLTVSDSTVIVFLPESLLKLLPSAKGNYEILRVHNVTDVILIAPKLTGDRYTHKSSNGEWGMGVSIPSSENIKVIDAQINECWGDGIYIGRTSKNNASKDIRISGGIINESRRNGISIISVDGLNIDGVLIANTYGTNPQAAIDFEPNKSDELLRCIVKDTKLYNNKNQGVLFVFNQLKQSQALVDIQLSGINIEGTRRSVGFMNTAASLEGRIALRNIRSSNNNKDLHVYDNTIKNKLDLKMSFRKNELSLKVQDPYKFVKLR